jgi:hypothetical protein
VIASSIIGTFVFTSCVAAVRPLTHCRSTILNGSLKAKQKWCGKSTLKWEVVTLHYTVPLSEDDISKLFAWPQSAATTYVSRFLLAWALDRSILPKFSRDVLVTAKGNL